MKFAVVGAGISGLSIGRMLQENGHEVVVFEKESNPGGLIACDWINGNLFHKVGGHVFNSKNSEVLSWFWKHFDREREFVKATRNAKVFINGQIIGYPIENHLFMLDDKFVEQVIGELIELQKLPVQSPYDYPNFEIFLRCNFGETLFETYFGPYNNKLWQTDLSKVAMEWLDGKLPMPNFKEIVTSNVLRREEANMVHSSFFYPLKGGSQFIINRLAESLQIKTDQEVKTITFSGGKLRVNTEGDFDNVIWTGNVKNLPDSVLEFLASGKVALNDLLALHANGTSNLLCESDDTDISWLYIPGTFTKAHRIIYTGNFSPHNNNADIGRRSCVVEFSGKVDFDVMVNEIQKLPGNLKPMAFNYEPSSYIVQEHKTRELIDETKRVLRRKNIFLLGRFAEWEYYNMDKCMENAMLLMKEFK